VLGGGAVGCELGQAFARLGAEVSIVETAQRLVGREEPRASAVLAAALSAAGVRVLTLLKVTQASTVAGDVELMVSGVGPLRADRMLVATGRRLNTAGLGLQHAGERLDEQGAVVVDRRLRTSNPRIYAGGDVTGTLPFTHVAGLHGSIAVTNALLAPLRAIDHDTMPWVTFTDPEIAHVGLTEEQARSRHGSAVRSRLLGHDHVDRAITEDDTDGFTQVVLDGHGRVLGVTVVAPRAGEMLAELTGLIARRGRLRDLASVVHPYPGDGVWNASLAQLQVAMGTPTIRRATRVLARLRRTTTPLRIGRSAKTYPGTRS